MNTQVTVTLPEDVLQRVEWWAQRSGRSVADLLAETIELSLRPLGPPPPEERLLSAWSDEEVLAATEADLPPAANQRLSELLQRQQAGSLPERERAELTGLMSLYQQGLLRKAQALREAVHRGLRETLQP